VKLSNSRTALAWRNWMGSVDVLDSENANG
jgi:hypothetical protein